MHYTQDEFFRLMEAIEAQGGDHLDETHDPVYHTPLTGDHLKGIEVMYCNAEALFEIPYKGLDKDGKELATCAPVKVCAVDDMVGLWPRFASAKAPGRP